VQFDPSGNLFLSDNGNARVREITPAGIITTIAGNGSFSYCGDGGLATLACVNSPEELAIANTASDELIYIADTYDCRIRVVSMKTGVINTVAGNGICSYSGDGGPATEASLNLPYGVAVDPNTNNLLISDTQNNVIREVDTQTGIINTVYGNPASACSGINQSELCFPEGLNFDRRGNLYVADSAEGRILKLNDRVAVIVGVSDDFGFNGDGIPATAAFLNNVSSIAVDNSGNLVTVDAGNQRIRYGGGAQLITTVAGGYIGDGAPGPKANINSGGIFQNDAVDSEGNLYIADPQNFRIRKVTRKSGIISTFAGSGFSGYTGDGGPATQAKLNSPQGVAVDRSGNVFIADTNNFVIRKVDTNGLITTFASELFIPSAMAFDPAGNLYVADYVFCTVWEITPSGIGTIIAGEEFQCGYNSDGIPATEAMLNEPTGIAVDVFTGELYIADASSNRIRAVNQQGIISTVAGNGTCGYSGDGGPAADAMVCFPLGVAANGRFGFYLADLGNERIRAVDRSGVISTFAGTGIYGYNGDGLPAAETNISPGCLVTDSSADLFFCDVGSYRVRIVH